MQKNSFELQLKLKAKRVPRSCLRQEDAGADKFGMKLTVAQLAERIGAELVGDGCGLIIAVGAVETAGANDVTFITNDRHIPRLKKSQAAAVIIGRRIEGLAKPQLIVKNVEAALIETLNVFAPKLKAAPEGIDPSAKVGQNVRIAKGVSVGAGVVIDDGVEIGENSVIASGCKIGENSKLGKNCRLDSNIVVYHNCTIGDNVIIQANSTIGSTGFGYSFIDGSHKLIPHNGGVVIEDFVEIGANCCVDRAKFGNTIIGAGTKIDNLVQIAHNVVIGKCCLIAGQVGISGSCKIGDGVVLAGQVGLADNIEIGNGVMVGARSALMSDVAAGKKMFGYPAIEKTEALRIFSLTRRLPELTELLKQLRKRIEKLEAAKDDKK
jgi:UDP-3-O-[3-hydroxymyristoyl] glucosamine N-acyltransferase